MKAEVYNMQNQAVGQIDLPEVVFGVRWNPRLIHQALVAQLANRRHPWAHAKGRGEVRGGGRKPWRQKGTGRARHGSIRSPLWVGGGKSHGPNKERDYSQKLNKKMRRRAIASILSKRWKEGEVKFFDAITVSAPKTKALYGALAPLVGATKKARRLDALLVPGGVNPNLARASANLEKVKVLMPSDLNVYDLLNYKHIFLDEKAVPTIAKQHQARV